MSTTESAVKSLDQKKDELPGTHATPAGGITRRSFLTACGLALASTSALVVAGSIATRGTNGLALAADKSSDNDGVASSNARDASSGNESTHQVVDMMGDTIDVPNDIDRIIVTIPALAQTAIVVGAGDRIIGGYVLKTDMNLKVNPWIEQVENVKPGTMDAETAISLEPDLAIWMSSQEVPEGIYDAGIAVVRCSLTDVESVMESASVIGEALGGESIERAKKYQEFYEDVRSTAQELTADIADEDKPIVYLTNTDDGTGSMGPNSPTCDWVKDCGGLYAPEIMGDTSESLDATYGIEQIIEVNPDIVIATTRAGMELFLTDERFASISAVQNGRVYLNPLGCSVWYKAHAEAPLQYPWALSVIQPEIAEEAGIDVEASTREFYETFYDYELTDEDMEEILDPTEGSF